MSEAAMNALAQKHTRRAFILRIAGLDVEYWGGAGGVPGRTLMPNTAVNRVYRQREAIVNVSALRGKLFPEGGISEPSVIEVTLAGDIRDPDRDDPVTVFGRCGWRSADNRAQLLTAVAQGTGGGTLVVDRDVSGWSYPLPVHLDAEAFWATAGTAVPPYEITYTARGSIGTVPQIHAARSGEYADVTDTLVNFRTRRATLYMADVHPGANGNRTSYVELMRGFLDEPPSVDSASGRVTVRVVPLAGLLQVELASPTGPSTLARGVHGFVHPHANGLVHTQRFEQGDAVNVHTTAADGAGALTVTAPVAQHAAVADVTLDDGHPRRVDLRSFRQMTPLVVTGYTGAGQHDIESGPSPALAAGDTIVNVDVEERHACPVQSGPPGTEVIAAWPSYIIGKINDSTDPDGWVPGTVSTADGAWADVRVTEDARIAIRTNMADHAGDLHVILPLGSRVPRSYLARDSDDILADNSETVYSGTGGVDWRDPAGDSDSDQRVIVVEKDRSDAGEGVAIVPFRGWARGWYQAGEPYILAADDLYVTPHRAVDVRVEWTDRYGEEHEAIVQVTSSTAKTLGGVTIGYAWGLTLHSRQVLPTFSAWDGIEPPRLTPILHFVAAKPGILILQLLTSGGGNLVNDGGYDVLPYGASLTSDEVDVGSFRAISPTPGLEAVTLTVRDDTIADVINPILIALGVSIVVRLDGQGRSRLTAIQTGLENAVEAVGEILAGDWLVSPPPSWGVDSEITNQLVIETDFDVEDKPQARANFRDGRSITTHGEGAKLTIPLRGVTIPNRDQPGAAEALFAGLAARIFRQLADPRRTFETSVYTGAAIRAQIGAVYRLTSPHLKGYGTAIGVTRILARVVEVEVDVWREGARLTFVHYGTAGAGWGFSGTVESVPSSTTVTLSENDFTVSTGTLVDPDGVVAGGVVRWVPEVDNDGFVDGLVVTAVDTATRTVTFSAAHGIAHTATVPDVDAWLEADDYDAEVEVFMKGFAYLADSSGVLGATPDDGREIT